MPDDIRFKCALQPWFCAALQRFRPFLRCAIASVSNVVYLRKGAPRTKFWREEEAKVDVQKRVAIAGDAGFIGRHIAHKLITRGYEIRGLDSLIEQAPRADAERFKLSDEHGLIVGDVRNEDAMARAPRGVDNSHTFRRRGWRQSEQVCDRHLLHSLDLCTPD